MKQGFDVEAFFSTHRYLLDLLRSLNGGSVIPVLLQPFIPIAHTATPTTSNGWKFEADPSAGTVSLTLAGVPQANQLFRSSRSSGPSQIR